MTHVLAERTLESYRMRIADIRDVELEQLHALSMAVRWPHRADDWEMLREFGQGVAACDDIGRVMSTAMWFNHGEDFATVGMLITSPRLQTHGAGRWLMQHVIARTGARLLGLNATRAARPLYKSMGFRAEATVYQCQGEAKRPPEGVAAGLLRPLAPADLGEVAALDRRAFGADRHRLLCLLEEHSEGLVLVRNEVIVGFSMCRPFGRGHVLGPIVAESDDDALALLRPHVAHHAGGFLRLDTRLEGGPFTELVLASGLAFHDTVTTMSLGSRPWLPLNAGEGGPRTYTLASQALS
ncbi:MAG: GNAT family N-acetyltransferase [Alsobacter sp.]